MEQKKILLVDDDPDVLELLKTVVAKSGGIAVTASSAAEGLERFRESKPDLIIVDLMMETVDAGIDFANSVRETGSFAPLYILSSTGADLYRNFDASSIGCAGVLEKPVDPQRLLALIKARLG